MPVIMANSFSIIKKNKVKEESGEGLASKMTDSWDNKIWDAWKYLYHALPITQQNFDCFDMMMNGKRFLMCPGWSCNGRRHQEEKEFYFKATY
jgi:hypothetical protein